MQNDYGLCCCCMELACRKNLWTEYMWMGKVEIYGHMLKECFELSISLNQKPKEQICEVCITQLRNSMSFKRQVLECQVKLASQVRTDQQTGQIQLDPKLETIDNVLKCDDDDNFTPEDDMPIKSEELEPTITDSSHFIENDGDDDLFNKEGDDESFENDGDDVSFKNDGDDDIIKNYRDDDFKNPETVPKREVTSRKKIKKIGKETIIKHKTRKKTKEIKKKHDGRKENFIKPRQNVCLLLEHSTIVPFKSNKGYFNCFYCNKQYVAFEEIRTHVKDSHENATFKSIIKSILRPNDRIRADVSEIICRICSKKQDNLQELVHHLSKEHDIKFNEGVVKPDDCILPYDLGDGKYKCSVCQKEFLFYKTLTKHMNEHSSNYVCDVCGKCFILPARLRAHAQLHTQQSEVKCQYCPRVYSSYNSLRGHVRYSHKKTSYLCSICNRTFPTSRSRLKHLEEFHGRSPLNLNCQLCSKKFMTPSSLSMHVKNEHLKIPTEAKFECDECGMKFKSRYALGCHIVVHTGEKKFECNVCHKKFSRSGTLSEHLKIHSNDKRWSCGACAQTFVQKCSLKNHIRVHHGDMEIEQLIIYKKPDK